MPRLTAASSIVVLSLTCFLAACSSSSGGGGGHAGTTGGAGGGVGGSAAGGTTGIGGGSGTTGGVGGSAAGGAGGLAGAGGTPASGTGGDCNALPLTGIAIVQTAVTGAAPLPMGGPIADGLYRLTSNAAYPPATRDYTFNATITIQVTGNQFQEAEIEGGFVGRLTATISPVGSGTTLTTTSTCPTAGTVTSVPYTATLTTLQLFSGDTAVQTYTKQ